MKNLEFDRATRTFIRREEIRIGSAANTEDIEKIKKTLINELTRIPQQVKDLKRRAEEIKEMLSAIDRKTEPIGSAPVAVEVQSSSAASPDPTLP